ncbi:UNVERIFIED_CONTAM: hypothetical protein GTU68_002021 [Idotea baltica]|nr:hypothetical protein [Idotea baltica]
MANRHGLIAGATGTGKTVTLQVLAEGFSKRGVPVFTADVKGDLSGISQAGATHPKIDERIEKIGLSDFGFSARPTLLWDIFQKEGHPLRTTISEMGPLLLAKLLDLNETQEGVLNIAFRVADDQGLLLLDLKDLRSMLNWVGEHSSDLRNEYGNVSSASVGAIQRRLVTLEEAKAENFFGEPALKIANLMQVDFSGNGVISLLDARELMQDSRLYSTFLLWLLSELFEELEEVGDQEKPQLVFFFDEAHLLFKDASKALMEKIETVTRLIRSKGVGIYFVTQSPSDIPETVLGQLGNRVQHALRAYTPSAQKKIKAAADAFRENPLFSTEDVITELGVGEALVSTLDEKGTPSIVQRVLICPPESRIGPATDDERRTLLSRSPLKGIYDTTVDRESAYELLKERRIDEEKAEQLAKEAKEREKEEKRASRRQTPTEALFKSVMRSVGSQLGRTITRGILGSILGGKKR